jgi:hypothetical protein
MVIFVAAVLAGPARGVAEGTLAVSEAGQWLAASLDRLDVEHHWLRGHEHVAWRTGVPLAPRRGRPLTPLLADETHCSAFAAAAAESVGVYLLHPPEHSHVLLANAQCLWLAGEKGAAAGWRPVATALEAQQRANRGELVVAAYKNPDALEPGHIAIVRPAAIDAARVEAEGPQIVQAGFDNFKSASLRQGFARHPGAWGGKRADGVAFYAHEVDPKKVAGE